MNRTVLIAYQLLTGLSDSATGMLLIAAPALTLRLMRLHVSPSALPFLAYIGVFVLSVGVACFYGAWLAVRTSSADRLETVWLLTAVTRALVCIFVAAKIMSGELEGGWLTVALTDGALALLQTIGLAKGWLRDVIA